MQNYIGHNVKIIEYLKTGPINEDEMKFNIDKLREYMIEYGISGITSNRDLLVPHARDILLFTIQLFQTLPHYIPKASIEFTCLLDEKVTKNIVLTNPSNKAIFYWVRLQSHKDFSIENDSIKIEPRATCQFPVVYHARISSPVAGRITFRNKRDGGVQAAALVFDLKSNVVGRESREKREIRNIKLYDMGTVDIPVNNPFDTEGTFTIRIEAIAQDPVKEEKKGKRGKGGESHSNGFGQNLALNCFFC